MNTEQKHIKVNHTNLTYSYFSIEINYKYMIRSSAKIEPVLDSRSLTLGVF